MGAALGFRWILILSPLLFDLSFALQAPSIPNCGNSSRPCAQGFCCSHFGYCGTGSAWCGPGSCRSQCPSSPPPPSPPPPSPPPPSPSVPPNCGDSGRPCGQGFCCSNFGYCGTGSAWCGPGSCRSQCPSSPPPPSPSSPNCGNSSRPCAQGSCCSNFGYCGTGSAWCGPGSCQSQCPSSRPPPSPPPPSPPPPSPSFPNCGDLGRPCAQGFCCSYFGYCGNGSAWCGPGSCKSQCPSSLPLLRFPWANASTGSGVGGIVTSSLYNAIFPNRSSFYTYNSFISAAALFPSFGGIGNSTEQKQDIAAFFALVTHETNGLQDMNEVGQSAYCQAGNTQYPCAPGQEYYGRGPLQITWNHNYGPCGQAIGQDLLHNPSLVATNSTISWESAMWFWTTAQSPKPSCEAVMYSPWTLSHADVSAGKAPGSGETIDIINGGLERLHAEYPSEAADWVTQYQHICGLLGVATDSNVPSCINLKASS